MSSLASPPHGRDQLVTASELVRSFGAWQDRAQRAPVYVLHRGRPRLVLTSVELMDALCAPHGGGEAATRQQLEALLDGTGEAVVLADNDGRVAAVGRTARAKLGVAVGEHAAGLAAGNPFLAAALDRVAATRTAEAVELTRDGRDYDCWLEPYPAGIALFVRDTSDTLAQRRLAAAAAAVAAAARADHGVAIVRIGLRGYIETPDAALAALTGIAVDALASARFVALMSVASRIAVADAIEAAVGGAAGAVDATLLVNRAPPLPVRVALAPVWGGRTVEAVAAIVRTQA